jgi:hypothetical protein
MKVEMDPEESDSKYVAKLRPRTLYFETVRNVREEAKLSQGLQQLILHL